MRLQGDQESSVAGDDQIYSSFHSPLSDLLIPDVDDGTNQDDVDLLSLIADTPEIRLSLDDVYFQTDHDDSSMVSQLEFNSMSLQANDATELQDKLPANPSQSAGKGNRIHDNSPDSPCSNSSKEEPPVAPSTVASSARWSDWTNLQETITAATPSQIPIANAVEARRRRNCQKMRHLRQRQRDGLQQMKDQVAHLEKQFAELCHRDQLSVEKENGTRRRRNASSSADTSAYAKAVALANQLVAENLFMKASIREQESQITKLVPIVASMAKLKYVLHANTLFPTSTRSLKCDLTNDKIDLKKPTLLSDALWENPEPISAEDAALVYRYRSVSENDVKEMILDHTQEIRRVQNRLLNSKTTGLWPQLEVLGWVLHRRLKGSINEFLFTKRFSNEVSVHELMEKTWHCHLTMEGFKKIKADTCRLDVLQYVNSNAFVYGRDVRAPDAPPLFRTVGLCYRMETTVELPNPQNPDGPMLLAKGYCIGTHSMNPVVPVGSPSCLFDVPEHEILNWADLTVSLEFLTVTDPSTNESFVEVRWIGRTNYRTSTHATRNAGDKLSHVLRWEIMAIGPALKIISRLDEEEDVP